MHVFVCFVVYVYAHVCVQLDNFLKYNLREYTFTYRRVTIGTEELRQEC